MKIKAHIKTAALKYYPYLMSLKTGYLFYIVVGFVVLVASIILLYDSKSELLATLWISAIAAILSFNSYVYTKEKFRLDLLDKRFGIYEKTLEFCSLVFQQGTLTPREGNQETILAAVNAAHESFRGIGYHKARAFFGRDINDKFEALNKSYAWLSAGHSFQSDSNYAENKHHHLTVIWKTSDELPELFKPYIYFGDYRRDYIHRP